MSVEVRSPVVVENPEGAGAFVIVCDHASNRIPEDWSIVRLCRGCASNAHRLGLRRISGGAASGVAAGCAAIVAGCLPTDHRLQPRARCRAVSSSPRAEGRPVPANRALSADERSRRLGRIHAPYHAAIDACLTRRDEARRPTMFVAIHSFTPVYFGKPRPWQIGIVFGDDRRLADILIRKLQSDPALTVGGQRAIFARRPGLLYRRAPCRPRRLPAAMIEIRNNEIGELKASKTGRTRLASLLIGAKGSLLETRQAVV